MNLEFVNEVLNRARLTPMELGRTELQKVNSDHELRQILQASTIQLPTQTVSKPQNRPRTTGKSLTLQGFASGFDSALFFFSWLVDLFVLSC